MRKPKVYIASPYAIGNQLENVRRSLVVKHDLRKFGIICYAPLLNHFEHEMFPQPASVWMEEDKAWLTVCDAVLRLSGESKGADEEELLAKRRGIPVFKDIGELLDWKERHYAST